MHTPTPWTGFSDDGLCVALMPAGRPGDVCTFKVPPCNADADFILRAVNSHDAMAEALKEAVLSLRHSLTFITSRKRMHQDGVALHQDAIETALAALALAAPPVEQAKTEVEG